MIPDGGIRARDRERTQDPDGKRSAAGGQRVADVQARVTEPVTGERVHEPAGRSAGFPGREQPEAEIPHATFGCALLDCPPLCCMPR